ncbi:MAG: hypothetical protein RIC18_11865 [Hoeflea sp.]|uniref:hypothetical protein n=1 Tax=Hoeflea sp. TaxID=1940281 RepID=UPI0032ED6129
MTTDLRGRPAFFALTVLGLSVVAVAAALMLPLELPIGASFWDTYIYLDGAYRMEQGQQIYRDFHAPVGPLSYILFGVLHSVFETANIVLLIQWCLMLVTVPVMAVICWSAARRGTFAALALLVPYLVFSVLPFNVVSWNVFPGVDGFGYYNRHGAVLLYLLVAALFFVPSRLAQVLVISTLLLTLAFTKINAFAAAGLILFVAVVTRRIGLATSLAVAAICLSVAAVTELITGVVSAYLLSVLRILENNTGVLFQNIMFTVSMRFDVILAGGLLALYLLGSHIRGGTDLVADFDRPAVRPLSPNFLDRDWVWVGVLIAANILYESQNWGSAASISVWPLLVVFLLARPWGEVSARPALALLVALTMLPTFTKVVHSAFRAAATSVRDASIETPNLPPSINMSAKDLSVRGAEKSRRVMEQHRAAYEHYARENILPHYWLYFDHRFQVNVLETMNEVISAIREREAELGRRYEVIDLRDFANPIVAAMGRTPARGVAIGGDPYRAAFPLIEAEIEMLSEADLVLLPVCPVTAAREKLLADHAAAFAGFRRIRLTGCFDALENPKFSAAGQGGT